MAQPIVAVVVLNYNGRNLLQQFIPTIIKYSSGASVYVVDNASTDDSVSFLEKEFPQVKIIILRRKPALAYHTALPQFPE